MLECAAMISVRQNLLGLFALVGLGLAGLDLARRAADAAAGADRGAAADAGITGGQRRALAHGPAFAFRGHFGVAQLARDAEALTGRAAHAHDDFLAVIIGRAFFDALIARRGVRPTALQPAWNIAGFALGAATAALGPTAAMACTVAVETEIDLHYQEQLDALGADDPELAAAVAEFRAEELEHKDSALAAGAETAPAYPLLAGAIRLACKTAIAVSKRL
jgi:demethoxyubiquinone hydroxylase (CLK1/Coq7/Cat5 family)